MIRHFSFLFALLLFTVPLGALAQDRKPCRLCDPLDPPDSPAKKTAEDPLGDRVIIGVTGAWNRFDAAWSNFSGTSLTFLFTRHFGLEGTFELNDEIFHEIPLEDQERRIEARFSLSGIWFFDGLAPHHGLSPYGKLGSIYQGLVQYEAYTDTTRDLAIPFALQVGVGLMARYRIVSFGLEATAISPGFSMRNELVEGSLNLRFFVGFHVDSLLWALLLPLGFI